MHRRIILILVLLSWIVLLSPPTTAAQAGIAATNNTASQEFPEGITFSVDLQSDAEINRVVLEYGVQQLACGTVVGKAFPKFTPSKSLTIQWTWEMKQSGSQPPGATIWWRWRVANAGGKELLTDQQTLIWLDDGHPWQVVSGKQINLHWYSGSRAFASELRGAAEKALANLAEKTGLAPDEPIDLYIYASTADLREAVLYEPGWAGGMAFAQNNSVIVGIAANQMEWGKSTVAHELTHVLVGRFTFSCLGDEPTWLSEGLAMYGEGGLDTASERLFKAAVTNDTLMSVRALSGGFSEEQDRANVSYSQSYSLVNFLINEYGKDKMMALLRALRDGAVVDDALEAIYGFDTDGFEDAWRAKIGAKPRPATDRPAATVTPTIVPTFVPVAGVVTPSPSPTPAPPTATATATPIGTDTPAAPSKPSSDQPGVPSWPIIGLLFGTMLVIAAIVSVIVVVRRKRS